MFASLLRLPLHWQIFIAIVLAVVVGLIFNLGPGPASDATAQASSIFAFFGTLFLNALKMVVVPLIFSSIVVGVASLGQEQGLARLSLRTLGFYGLTTLAAVLIGLVFVNWFAPGIVDGEPARELLNLSNTQDVQNQLGRVEGRSLKDVFEIFHRLVPSNVVAAAASAQILGLIFFAILFGFFATRIETQLSQTIIQFWQAVFEIMMRITLFVMAFAPIGVFALIANTVSSTGFGAFKPLLVFFICVALALIVHVSLTMSLLLRIVAKVNPIKLVQALAPALLTAFSTASSSGTLPLTMKSMQERAGISDRISAFVLPLGATVNMNGTALYECVAALFIAQAYGMELDLVTQFTVVITALLTSIGVAGIPSASLVAIAVILGAIGLPLEGIAALMVTDRILDMMRTAVNVYGDAVCATYIAHSEGESLMPIR